MTDLPGQPAGLPQIYSERRKFMFKGLFRTLFTVLGLVIGFGLTELTIYLL